MMKRIVFEFLIKRTISQRIIITKLPSTYSRMRYQEFLSSNYGQTKTAAKISKRKHWMIITASFLFLISSCSLQQYSYLDCNDKKPSSCVPRLFLLLGLQFFTVFSFSPSCYFSPFSLKKNEERSVPSSSCIVYYTITRVVYISHFYNYLYWWW